MKIAIIVLILLSGAFNGGMDTLQFHYQGSFFSRLGNDQYFNPAISWTNKYLKDEKGKVLIPLKPAFWGSTTYFSFTTDAWHLFKFFYQGALRLVIVLLALQALAIQKKWWIVLLVWLGLGLIQAISFHLTYSIIF